MLKKSTTFLTKFFTWLKLKLPTLPEVSSIKAKSTDVWQTGKKKEREKWEKGKIPFYRMPCFLGVSRTHWKIIILALKTEEFISKQASYHARKQANKCICQLLRSFLVTSIISLHFVYESSRNCKINDVLEFYLVFKGKLDTRKKICLVVHHTNS